MSARTMFVILGVAAVAIYGALTNEKPTAPKTPLPTVQALLEPPPSAPTAPAPIITAQIEPVPLPRPKPQFVPRADKNVEMVLTAAAIAAVLVQASRESYYATGRPCACPEDKMRNNRRCGANSAYSKPGGAEPLCYVSDVTPAMIEAYRRRAATGSAKQAAR